MFTYCPPKILQDVNSETSSGGKRIYTLPDGSRLPSITTILSLQSRDSIASWRKRVGNEEANRVSVRASGTGKRVHSLCEDFIQNKPLKETMPDALVMFKSIKPVLQERVNNIHYVEQAFYSKTIGAAGRSDLIGEFDKVLSVMDYKTSSKIKYRSNILSYFWQSTFYALAYEELVGTPIDQIVIIMAVAEIIVRSEPTPYQEPARRAYHEPYEEPESPNPYGHRRGADSDFI
jgi:genome maintenance exonuclease 1